MTNYKGQKENDPGISALNKRKQFRLKVDEMANDVKYIHLLCLPICPLSFLSINKIINIFSHLNDT